jgi:hypothetical protein
MVHAAALRHGPRVIAIIRDGYGAAAWQDPAAGRLTGT